MFKKDQLVWVPKVALALWSKPDNNSKDLNSLWNVGIIIDKDNEGNIKVLVNGQLEYTHTNFIKPMD